MIKSKLKKGILIVAVACLAVVAGYYIRQNSHVKFADENMGIVICNTIGNGVTPETVRYKDLARVRRLKTGYLGYYETLDDIKKCRNIEVLIMNGYSNEWDASYEVTNNEVGKILTEEEVKRIEEELAQILPRLNKLETFTFTDAGSNCNIQNWDYLQRCSNLQEVIVEGSKVTEYGFLEKISGVKVINLWGSQIETADSFVNLQDLERLCIFDTPLAENEAEVQRLCEALPNTEILVEPGRVEHKSDIPWWKDTE